MKRAFIVSQKWKVFPVVIISVMEHEQDIRERAGETKGVLFGNSGVHKSVLLKTTSIEGHLIPSYVPYFTIV